MSAAVHRYAARIAWERGDQPFTDRRYSRRHAWHFDGGAVVAGSSSPLSVPLPMSDASAVDPEEAFVASVSSCHLLWFLDFAVRAGWVVDAYDDDASGTMGRNAAGKVAMLEVTLRPRVRFSGRQPDDAEHQRLHHAAHEACYIANSVNCPIHCEPTLAGATEGS
jgi:organic hydroperoxide reductase OsmC/OhrA